MSTNKTTHYQLNQWEAEDKVLRTEFNEDNQKIDAAMRNLYSAVPRVASGFYVGDGTEVRLIELEFTPRAVFVCRNNGCTYESGTIWGGLAVTGSPLVESYGSQTCTGLAIAENGFLVYNEKISYRSGASNALGQTYHYIALG